jgi:hypothetical protein
MALSAARVLQPFSPPSSLRSPRAHTPSDQAACSNPPAVAKRSAGSVSARSSGNPWVISSESATERPAIESRSETAKQ